MSEASETQPSSSARAASRPRTGDAGDAKRKKSSVWIGLGFVGLLCAGFVISQLAAYSGPEVEWIRDLDTAMGKAGQSNRRVLLYVHRADCPTTSEHDRGLFQQRFARLTIAQMIPCRIEVKRETPLAGRFGFEGDPLMIVLEPDGDEVYRLEGLVDERQFTTFIHPE